MLLIFARSLILDLRRRYALCRSAAFLCLAGRPTGRLRALMTGISAMVQQSCGFLVRPRRSRIRAADLMITKVQRLFFSVFDSLSYLISFRISFIFVRNRFGQFGTFG